MDQRHLGLIKPIADPYTEAAIVCLDPHHKSPTEFDLDRSGLRSAPTVDSLFPNLRAPGVLRAIHPDRDWVELAHDEDLTVRVDAVRQEVAHVTGSLVNTAVLVYATTVAAQHRLPDIAPDTSKP